MQKIAVVGTGYVGLVTGTCLSDFGLETICVDIDETKIKRLKEGHIPIYEPGLEEMVTRNIQYRRLEFTTDIQSAVEQAEVIFIAVGTPAREDGSADLKYVLTVAEQIARSMNGYKVIVNKSTVPVGTGQKVKEVVQQVLDETGKSFEFDVVSNPEFLREGNALHDFTHPDKVVVGTESQRAKDIMKQVYRVLYLNETPFIFTNIETAEMIKYANNAFLAVKISFINEIANLCEKVGANVQQLAQAIGKDGRIGSKFLHAGPGYGGSCFPKDTLALAHIGQAYDSPMRLVETTIEVNERQKLNMVEKIETAYEGGLAGRKLAILGLTFKPKTDDMRDAPSLTIIRELEKRGVSFRVYDPAGMEEGRWRLEGVRGLEFCTDEYSAMEGCDGVVIVTEWHQFRNLDLKRVQELLVSPNFFDLRNIYDKAEMANQGFAYYGVGV
ncbi:UDP-glucose dehydrogenase family protein [Paenibacillus mucilaginosus]|uniref:UDP-glucose 6-dehydrogenase n=1 Tax=Paenibacillus mucilaginosus (strain KNP414) TaxID=1036673 RepID=F8F7Q9_PAEMK|nr:UDP-glucose/GDP-mannose dehydrogenase family protein [Paenibacillus mucilaginosus]AEI39544.1 RkpK [Paenibacillus mucilaginosus KNP414]MCG7214638.1 UDP-glucose/GDP-mannose dehydrogenase family protein [Paenibacillus mucilaginosus]WDM28501.1 UDP-glucose/GDP-mannose dehydrogenase family protein [Paenibacillus mucilaginosus]